MKTTIQLCVLFGLGAASALAQSNSSSLSYKLLSAPSQGGGGEVGNGSNIKAQLSIGGLAGGTVSQVTASGVQEKPNYIGQLYDIAAVTVNASPLTIDEGGSRQLGAAAILDDSSELILAEPDVQWSIVLGSLTGIDASGLATAGLVYVDTAATVQASSQGVDGQLGLTVLNINVDDFGAYAGDGLADHWQVDFFGDPPNLEAAPDANPDADPYDNLIEFLTGYDPLDSGDYFRLQVVDLTGSITTLELSKVIPGTRYRIERRNHLVSDPWTEYTNFTTLSELFDHQVTDPNAIGQRWFYRVGVESE